MVKNDDWRLFNQMEYLYEKEMMQIPYQPYRPGWEHDHCEFCCATIDKNTKDAYCTTDQYHWVCRECFEDFKDMFHWNLTD